MIPPVAPAWLVHHHVYFTTNEVVLLYQFFKAVILGIHDIGRHTTLAIILQKGIYITMNIVTIETGCVICSRYTGTIGIAHIAYTVTQIFLLYYQPAAYSTEA